MYFKNCFDTFALCAGYWPCSCCPWYRLLGTKWQPLQSNVSTFKHWLKKRENILPVEFMYFVFTIIPGDSYRRWFRSLCLCDVFQALINSLARWLIFKKWGPEIKWTTAVFFSPSSFHSYWYGPVVLFHFSFLLILFSLLLQKVWKAESSWYQSQQQNCKYALHFSYSCAFSSLKTNSRHFSSPDISLTNTGLHIY